jgi:hypothetical protein
MSSERPKRKTYSEAMNEWATREGRASFTDRSRVSTFTPDPFAHPVIRLLGYLWRLGFVALLGLAVYYFLFRSHLASKEFATRLAGQVKTSLGADTAQLTTLKWNGGHATARQFSATGGDGAFFRSLEAQDVAFRVPFSMYWAPEWRLPRVEAGSLQVEFRSGGLHAQEAPGMDPLLGDTPEGLSPPVLTAPGASLSLDVDAPDPSVAPEVKPGDKRVLDLDLRKDGFSVSPRVESVRFGGVEATRFSAGWGMSDSTRGELRDASLRAMRGHDGAWSIEIPAGTLRQNWLRDIHVTNLRARYADGVLTVENTPVQVAGVPAMLAGQVTCAATPKFDLTLQGEAMPLETFCGEPFDRLFNLQTTGTFTIGGSTNLATGVTVTAALQATGGFIRGLAIQQALATATTRIRFREFEITGGTLALTTGGGRLEVTAFDLVSRGDVTLRGRFGYRDSMFSGQLELGVDPALLQKLAPEVQDQFFPASAEGKRWISVPLEGDHEQLTVALAREFTAAHEAAGRR